MKVLIKLNNNKGQVAGGSKLLNQIVPDFQIKSPGYFWSPAWRSHQWDGKIKYVSDYGYFQTGLLPQIIAWLESKGYEYEIIENRDTDIPHKFPIKTVGEYTLRENQIEAIGSVVLNKVGGIIFPRGIIAASTNAGKTLIAAGIFKVYKKPTILLINNKTLFEQFEDELPTLLGDYFGVVSSSKEEWKPFTMAMVQTLVARSEKYKRHLINFKVAIVDECHLATSKSYKSVITNLYNTVVRVGLSGSALEHKDKNKNQNIRAFFGDILHKISSKELEEKGYSSPIIVKITKGNETIRYDKDYTREYEEGIIKNNDRNGKIWKRVARHIRKERLPILIVVKNHEHIHQLLKACPEQIKNDYLIKFIHHEVKQRKAILDEFRAGHVDILISSMIIKIGQNLPLIKATVNAGGGDSNINTLQLLGRNKRTHHSKKKTWYEDFWDKGSYLSRHSKHRRFVYIKEGHKVIDTWKQ